MKIQIFQIKVNEGRREVSPEAVHKLADSISKVGMLNPITVDQDYTLIAGLHRLEAAKLLGWSEIECTVSSLEGIQAELAEIDENFVRRDLSDMEYDDLLLRRKEIYEILHPETRQGKRNGQTSKTDTGSVLETKSFSQDTAEKLGVTPRTVERKVQIAKNLIPEVKEIVDRHGIGFRNALKLSRLAPEQQKEAASQLAAGDIHSVDQYHPTLPDPAGADNSGKKLGNQEPSIVSQDSAEGYYATIKDSVNDLKNPDKDRHGTPDTFLTAFLFFLHRFCRDAETYVGGEYEPIFPMLTQEHLDQLYQEIQTVHTVIDDLLNKIEGKVQK